MDQSEIQRLDEWLKDDACRIRKLTTIPEEIKNQAIYELRLAKVTKVVSVDLVEKLRKFNQIQNKKDN